MLKKRFINTTQEMQDAILELLKQKFLEKQFYSTTADVSVSVNIDELVQKEIEAKHIETPELYILDTAYLKVRKLVDECTGEVGWHCLVEKHDNKYIIFDVLVFPQYVTAATVSGVDGDYETWLATLPDEQFDYLRCHMHSHVNMMTTPSGTDENYYSNLMTQVQDYYITVITNKRNENYIRFYDVANNIVFTDLDITICKEDGSTYNEWYETVKDNIKTRTVTTTPSSYHPSTVPEDKWNKKKETTSTTKTITIGKEQKPGGKKKEYTTRLTSPMGLVYENCDIDHATNIIAAAYTKLYPNLKKNHIRQSLAKVGYCAVYLRTGDLKTGIYKDEATIELAMHTCDIWFFDENKDA